MYEIHNALCLSTSSGGGRVSLKYLDECSLKKKEETLLISNECIYKDGNEMNLHWQRR